MEGGEGQRCGGPGGAQAAAEPAEGGLSSVKELLTQSVRGSFEREGSCQQGKMGGGDC